MANLAAKVAMAKGNFVLELIGVYGGSGGGISAI
jgi:hypothetical protein